MRANTTSLLRHIYRYEEICDKIKTRDLKERFPSTYQLCDDDLNKFMLLLGKGVYPYQYTDSWEKFNKTTLPTMEEFYDPLNLEDISKEDHAHAQKVWDTFNIQNLGEYHDLYVQLDTLLLSDVYENFRDLCSDIYQLDSAHFLSAPGLAWQACLKMTKVKLELLLDEDMFLMNERNMWRLMSSNSWTCCSKQ